jgi:light-regulated signal transduction histidine kinase (bacteriophytochrome)
LPSLLGQHFPEEDIPLAMRQLYCQKRQRTIVNVASQQIGMSASVDNCDREYIQFRTVDPCHAEYLTAMGVQSSLVVPIMDDDRLWGLLVSHHRLPRIVTERELENDCNCLAATFSPFALGKLNNQTFEPTVKLLLQVRVNKLIAPFPDKQRGDDQFFFQFSPKPSLTTSLQA